MHLGTAATEMQFYLRCLRFAKIVKWNRKRDLHESNEHYSGKFIVALIDVLIKGDLVALVFRK